MGEETGVSNRVYIGLGSNLGAKGSNLAKALEALEQAGVPAVLRSSVYRTEPVDMLDQDEFLNQVAACRSDLPLERLLSICLTIERALGRVRAQDKGPRLIDLDLLLRGEEVRRDATIEVPHPRLHLRRFVLVPLVEIAPAAWHPLLKTTAAELLRRCPDRSRVDCVGLGGRL